MKKTNTMKKQPLDDAGLTPTQRLELKGALEQMREDLARRRAERVKAVTTPNTEVMDDGDSAAQIDTELTQVSLAENEQALLQRIDGALQRLQRGTYGLDVETGEPIGYPRLKALPWATRAVVREERREREPWRAA